MEEKNFLPIGTVVLLKGAKRKIMITGYLPIYKKKNKVYDYSACLWPIGYLDSETMIAFDKEVIEKVCFVGYSNEEQQQFYETISSHDKNEVKELLEKENNDDFTFQNRE